MNNLSDIQNLFKKYLPHFFNVFPQSHSKWRKIEEKYDQRYKQMSEAVRVKGEFSAEKTLFDWIWDAGDGDNSAQAFLEFLDEIIKELCELLPDQQQGSLRNICYQVAINFDATQSRYHTSVGELAVLHKLLKEGKNKNIKLYKIEYELKNRKKIDFAVKTDGEITLVEVMNIDMDVSKINSEEDLHVFLMGRYEEKLRDKLGGFSISEPNDMRKCIGGHLFLAPVVWGNTNDLEPYIDCFKSFQRENINIIPTVFTICQLFNRNVGYKYAFVKVDEYLEFISKVEE